MCVSENSNHKMSSKRLYVKLNQYRRAIFNERHLLMVIVLIKVGISVSDVSNRWKDASTYGAAIDNVARLALDMKEKAEASRLEIFEEVWDLCRRQLGPDVKQCKITRFPSMNEFLKRVDESIAEYHHNMDVTLPARRVELAVDYADVAMEAANAVGRILLMMALLWPDAKWLPLSAAKVAMLSMLGPAIRYGVAWLLAYYLQLQEDRFGDVYIRAIQRRLLFHQYGPNWTSSLSLWPCLLLLIYPVADHFADHEVWLKSVTGGKDKAVDIVFFVIHLYYYDLIKDFWQEQKMLSRREKKRKIHINKLPGFRQFTRPGEVLMHACVYGHHKRVRACLRLPDFDASAVTAGGGWNCLHVAIFKQDEILVKLILGATQGQDGRCALVGAVAADGGLNCAEMAASAASVAVARCVFRAPRALWERHCPPQRAVRLAVEEGNYRVASEMASWFKLDDAVTMDLVRVLLNPKASTDKSFKTKLLARIPSLQSRGASKSQNAGSKPVNEEAASTVLTNKLSGFFECPVCMEDMTVERIFACSNDHWLCSACSSHKQVSSCPICREDFEDNPPRRCLTAEKIAQSVLSQNRQSS